MRVLRRLALVTGGGAMALAAVLVAPPAVSADTAAGPVCTVRGTPGPDVLTGTPGPDVLCGLGGDDVLVGGAGGDVLIGGAGDDVLVGGAGGDTLIGGAGTDTLVGGAGKDALTAAEAPDRGREVLVLPKYQLPVGSRVTWTSLASNPTCIARAAGSWTDYVGSGPAEPHFLLEGSSTPQCRGESVHYRWQVKIQSATSTEVIVAHVTADVDFGKGAVPAGTMGCSFVTEGLSCAGQRNTQPFTPLLPLLLPITLGPTG